MTAAPREPRWHLRPAAGWLNDPNGLCRHDGRWHVFYQYQPGEPVHRDICWGHASTADLVDWQHHPVALRPTPGGLDAAGCWSGCLVLDGDTPTAVYSGVASSAPSTVVALARGDSALHRFAALPDPAAPAPAGLVGVTEARDPFVFCVDGHRYGIQGAGAPGGTACVLIHGCDELTRWSTPQVFLSADDHVAREVAMAEIWECPSLVPLDDRWLLVVSTIRRAGAADPTLAVSWMLGDLVLTDEGPRFSAAIGGRFDDGDAWYAPQLLAEGGRILAWGWLRETARTSRMITESGWAGLLSLPREVKLADDRVVMSPAAELTALRVGDLELSDDGRIHAECFELVATGPATLRADDREVAAVVGTADQPARILVDGDTVESFDEGGSAATRVSPWAEWTVLGEAGALRAYVLAVPAR